MMFKIKNEYEAKALSRVILFKNIYAKKTLTRKNLFGEHDLKLS